MLAAMFLACGAASSSGQSVQPSPPGSAASPDSLQRVLIDRELRRRNVRDIELTADAIKFRDLSGRTASVPRANILAIMPPDRSEAPAAEYDENEIVWKEVSDLKPEATGRIELVDGQLYPGSLGPIQQTPPQGDKPADKLPWNHALLGRLEFSLDVVSLAVLNTAGLDELDRLPLGGGDVVGLTNRDRVEGFVMSLVPRVAVETTKDPIMFPVGRVSFVRFSNPRQAAAGPRIWLYDGTVAAIGGIRSVDASSFGLQPPAVAATSGSLTLAAAEVMSISLDTRRLVPLSAAGFSARPFMGDGKLVTPPIVSGAANAPLGAGDVELPGPMVVEWTLPEGSKRIAGVAELPRNCRIWGDCTIVIDTGTGTPFRERLTGARPVVEFNLPITASASGSRITLTLDPGESGPIQDRVVLKRGLVAIDPPAGSR